VKSNLKEINSIRAKKYADSELMGFVQLKNEVKSFFTTEISDAFELISTFFNDSPILDEIIIKNSDVWLQKNT